MKITRSLIVLFISFFIRSLPGLGQIDIFADLPRDTVVEHIYGLADTPIFRSPKSFMEVVEHRLTDTSKFDLKYRQDSDIIATFKPYFIPQLCPPADVYNPLYLQFQQAAKYKLDTIKSAVIQKLNTDPTFIWEKTKRIKSFDSCTFELMPVYFLSTNTALYKAGDNIADYFTLDTAEFIFFIKKNDRPVGAIYQNRWGQPAFIKYPNSSDTAYQQAYQYCVDSIKQTPIFLIINIGITYPNSIEFDYRDLGYLYKKRLYTIKYISSDNSEFRGSIPVRKVFYKDYVHSSIEWYYQEAGNFVNIRAPLKERLEKIYNSITYNKRRTMVTETAKSINYTFSVDGMEGGPVGVGKKKRLGIAAGIYFNNISTGKTSGVSCYNYYERDSLKNIVELYDFNFDGYPDVYYMGDTRELDSNWSDNIVLYDTASAQYPLAQASNLFLNTRKAFTDNRYYSFNGIHPELLLDTLQDHPERGLRLVVRVSNNLKDTSTIYNPLDALTIRLANKDSGYNMMLPHTSRLLDKRNEQYNNKSFQVDSVIVHNRKLDVHGWQQRKISIPPKSSCDFYLRIQDVLADRAAVNNRFAAKLVKISSGIYHLLVVLAIIEENHRDVLAMDPVLVHLK
jgi:hypothetical protein